jgi:hypothetical protein
MEAERQPELCFQVVSNWYIGRKQIEADLAVLLSAYDDYLYYGQNESNTWIFQASPEYYDIRGAIRALKEQTWLVSQYKNRIHAGHNAYLWEAGSQAGILATAHVLTDPAEIPCREEEKRFIKNPEKFEGLQTRVVLRSDSVLKRPLLRKGLQNDPILSQLRVILQPRGTNYEVTPAQVTRIEQMLNHTPQVTLTRVLARVNSSFHFSFVAKRLLLTSGETAFSVIHFLSYTLESSTSPFAVWRRKENAICFWSAEIISCVLATQRCVPERFLGSSRGLTVRTSCRNPSQVTSQCPKSSQPLSPAPAMSWVPPGLRVAPESPRASFGLPEICSFHPGLMDQEDLTPGFH